MKEKKEKNECGCGNGKCPQCGSRHEQNTDSSRCKEAQHDVRRDIDYGGAWGGCPVGGAGFAFAAYGIL